MRCIRLWMGKLDVSAALGFTVASLSAFICCSISGRQEKLLFIITDHMICKLNSLCLYICIPSGLIPSYVKSCAEAFQFISQWELYLWRVNEQILLISPSKVCLNFINQTKLFHTFIFIFFI